MKLFDSITFHIAHVIEKISLFIYQLTRLNQNCFIYDSAYTLMTVHLEN
jgi:hypothetical protein